MESTVTDMALVAIGAIIAGSVGTWFATLRNQGKWRNIIEDTITKHKADMDLLAKAFVIQSRMIDDNVKKNHPKDTMKLQQVTREILGNGFKI